MRKLALTAAALAGALVSVAAVAQTVGGDPYIWLEEIEGAKPLAWVKDQNARTTPVLEGDRRYEPFRREAYAILTASDRIPDPQFLGDRLSNFWQDGAHPKGVWRRTTVAGYRQASPPWETLLDLDALGKSEGRNLIWKGATCLQPEERLCLVRLSNGGGDAVELREFDTQTKSFVPDGFGLSDQKQSVDWLDKDTLVVARDWSGTGADLTRSNYPYVVKTVRRGQPLSAATEIYRGQKSDVRADVRLLRETGGKVRAMIADRGVSFFESQSVLLTPQGPRPLPFPKKVQIAGLVDGKLAFLVREPFAGHEAGSLLAYDMAALERDPASAKAELIVTPGSTQAIQSVRRTRDRLLVTLLDDVKGAVDSYAHGPGGWTHARLALPKDSAVIVRDASTDSDRFFVSTEGFLTPPTLWLADAKALSTARLRQLPAQFDTSKHVVEQHFAVSADGTRVPYWLVRPRALKRDGSTPTQMFGYGGFEISETPVYKPEMGKLWLERGGAYVMANLRGGGEYGPRWHEAALRENRQRAFDDFAAVARDLAKTGVADAKHLGIYGRSNGGVLTTVSMTQHPELFHAVVVESPLVDMMRYQKLSAGASWVAEYGDPDTPADAAFISKYDGYLAVKPGTKLPEPYVTTNTRDDRVHPGHARKFAAKMEATGHPVLYYENTFGGHANDADPELNARRWARHYVYLSRKLMDGM